MLRWATRWKLGIYYGMKRAKILVKQMTVLIWKIWDPERPEKPKKKVEGQRITASKQKKYKAIKITNKLKVIRKSGRQVNYQFVSPSKTTANKRASKNLPTKIFYQR